MPLVATAASHGLRGARGGAPLAQHAAHRKRLIERAAGRIEVERQIAIAEALQEMG